MHRFIYEIYDVPSVIEFTFFRKVFVILVFVSSFLRFKSNPVRSVVYEIFAYFSSAPCLILWFLMLFWIAENMFPSQDNLQDIDSIY